eukprot:scaffold86520_cov41-Prasinocladus_malaysianus.AAC.1
MTKPNFSTKCKKDKCCCMLHSIGKPLPADSDCKEHAYNPIGWEIETWPLHTSARTCKTPGLSYASETCTGNL